MITTLLCVLLCRQDDEFVARMVRDLSSDRPGRAGAARAALLSSGAVALEPLRKAGTERALALAGEIRWSDPNVRAIFATLRGLRVTLDVRDEPVRKCIDRLIDGIVRVRAWDGELMRRWDAGDGEPRLTLKLENVTAEEALYRVAAAADLHIVAMDGAPCFTREVRPSVAARVPLRFAGASRPGVRERIAELASESLDGREEAERALLEAGLAAEAALWEALDSRDADLAGRAADVARRLYTAPTDTRAAALDRIVAKSPERITIVQLIDLAAPGMPFVAGPGTDAEMPVLGLNRIPGHLVLEVPLMTRDLGWDDVDGTIVIGRRAAIARTRRARDPVLWLDATQAALSPLVARTVQGEDVAPDAFATFGPTAVEALRYAERVTEGAARERCARLADRLVRETFAERWFVDEWSALVENKRVTLTASSDPLSSVLKTLSGQSGVDIRAERRGDEKVSLRVKDVPIGRVLEMLARPCGMTVARSGTSLILK